MNDVNGEATKFKAHHCICKLRPATETTALSGIYQERHSLQQPPVSHLNRALPRLAVKLHSCLGPLPLKHFAAWARLMATLLVRKTASFFEFSLCLSRACLGKMFVFRYKWRKNAVFRRTNQKRLCLSTFQMNKMICQDRLGTKTQGNPENAAVFSLTSGSP